MPQPGFASSPFTRFFQLSAELQYRRLLAQTGAQRCGYGVLDPRHPSDAGSGIEPVEDHHIPVRIVHGREGGNPHGLIQGGDRLHVLIFELVPGNVPARTVKLDPLVQIQGPELCIDGGQPRHQRQV